jgi:predicted TIM-barrel fold metal-dependent hydrolase
MKIIDAHTHLWMINRVEANKLVKSMKSAGIEKSIVIY